MSGSGYPVFQNCFHCETIKSGGEHVVRRLYALHDRRPHEYRHDSSFINNHGEVLAHSTKS